MVVLDRPINILIMEDETNLARLYSRVLRKVGYEVYVATTAANARFLLTKQSYRVLIADMRLGAESGLDLLREHYDSLAAQGTHIVVVSGNEKAQRHCEELGIKFFLTKPVLTYELVRVIERIISGRH